MKNIEKCRSDDPQRSARLGRTFGGGGLSSGGYPFKTQTWKLDSVCPHTYAPLSYGEA